MHSPNPAALGMMGIKVPVTPVRYTLELTQPTDAIDYDAPSQNYCITLPAGIYEAVERNNPFDNASGKKLVPWIALADRPNIGQIEESWKQKSGVRLTRVG